MFHHISEFGTIECPKLNSCQLVNCPFSHPNTEEPAAIVDGIDIQPYYWSPPEGEEMPNVNSPEPSGPLPYQPLATEQEDSTKKSGDGAKLAEIKEPLSCTASTSQEASSYTPSTSQGPSSSSASTSKEASSYTPSTSQRTSSSSASTSKVVPVTLVKGTSTAGTSGQSIVKPTNSPLKTLVKRPSSDHDDTFLFKTKRIAHQPTYDIKLAPKLKSCSSRTALQKTLLERYNKIYPERNVEVVRPSAASSVKRDKSKSKVVEETKVESNPVQEETLDIVGAILSGQSTSALQTQTKPSTSKGVSTKPAEITESKPKISLRPLKFETKIPASVRSEHLKKLFCEFFLTKDQTKEEAKVEACNAELEICRKTQLVLVYKSLVASKIKSLRTGSSGSAGTSTHINLSNNCSILRKAKTTVNDLSEQQRATFLEQLMIPVEQLADYGFPRLDQKTGLAVLPVDRKNKAELVDFRDGVVTQCARCSKHYSLPQEITEQVKCIYHSGKVFRKKSHGELVSYYNCCEGESSAIGCKTAPFHVTYGYEFRESRTGYLQTKPTNGPPKVYALDCEMCFTATAFEMTRVTIVDFDGKIIYDQIIKPKSPIIDYCSEYSGLTEKDFVGVTLTLDDVHSQLSSLISAECFLVGHGLDSDCRVLKLIHDRIVDTTFLFQHRRGLPYKRALRNLAREYLHKNIQTGEGGHSSAEDAETALELVKQCLNDEFKKFTFE